MMRAAAAVACCPTGAASPVALARMCVCVWREGRCVGYVGMCTCVGTYMSIPVWLVYAYICVPTCVVSLGLDYVCFCAYVCALCLCRQRAQTYAPACASLCIRLCTYVSSLCLCVASLYVCHGPTRVLTSPASLHVEVARTSLCESMHTLPLPPCCQSSRTSA